MKHLFLITFFVLISLCNPLSLVAQEVINVTFRYGTSEGALRAFVPGEFNNWGNNNSGRINVNDESLMTKDDENDFWYKIIPLVIGGGNATKNGKSGYAYKFHEQYNNNGSDWNWFSDPLNNSVVGSYNDSFLEVTHPLIFQMGPNNGIVDADYEFWTTVASIDSDSIDVLASEIFINDTLVGNFVNNYDKTRQLFYEKDISKFDLVTGLNEIKLKAVTNSGKTRIDSLNFTFIENSENFDQPRPEGLRDGITYGDDGTSVTLSLFAPYKDNVYVIGDFTGWTVDLDYKMYRDSVASDSIWFWLNIDNLSSDEEYGMQYLVDGEILIADPYSELVLNEFDDLYINENVFPNLKPYPNGLTSFSVTVLTPGKEKYDWEVENFNAPDSDKLVIYELLLRDFVEDHNYSTLIDTLNYLVELGINAIELMPVNEFEGNESWGYNPSFHLALDKYYGSPKEFKRFVDEAHKKGIAIIIDVVLNHAFGQNPLVRLWNQGDYGNPTSQNPYFNTAARHPFNVGYDFNHESPVTRNYSKRVMEYWLKEYKIDGFRFDLSKGFTQKNNPNDVGGWSDYDQSRIDIWFDYYNHIVKINSDAYVILEHFAANSEEKVLADGGMMLWGNGNNDYMEASMGYSSNLIGVLSFSRGFQYNNLVGYMESHDEQWMMFKNRKYGNSSGDYNIRDLSTALDRQELVGVFFFTLPGPKMLWQFGELGYGYGDNGEQCLKPGGTNGDCRSSDPGRTDKKPIRWDYFNDPDRRDVYTVWSQLINLRKQSEAFTRPDDSFYSLDNPIKYFRHSHVDTDIVTVGNFGVNAGTVNLEFTTSGTWHDFFEGTSIEIVDNNMQITLEPGDYKLFTTKQFDIITSASPENQKIISSFKLHQNYPNPFNPTTNIEYEVSSPGSVLLEVYSLLGQKVATLVNENKTIGSYTTRFDASGLSSGVYILKFTAKNKVLTQKMMLLK